MKQICLVASFLQIFSLGIIAQINVNNYFNPSSQPSFQVDYKSPTSDKPQSKLWFMNGYWWALLPRSSGPSLWQRTKDGWKEHIEIGIALRGQPGRADVWSDDKEVTAVGVAEKSLTVFRLKPDSKSSGTYWEAYVLAELIPPSADIPIETATIAKDGKGIWWVAAVADSRVCVWNTLLKSGKWTSPYILAEGTDQDDICVVTPLPDGIGVIWSDQVRDAVLLRVHKNGDPPGRWDNEEVIESGNKTADDHLNSSLATDGTLWLTTKNSVDMPGKPQFVLRIRSTDGKWKNIPYLNLDRMKRPSRPIVVATEDNTIIFTGHGDNDRSVPYPHDSKIIFARIDTMLTTVLINPQPVISPDSIFKSFVQNVTGPRHPFPQNVPWIILASDPEGRVYEADLQNLNLNP
jgi:hypothetical protein